MQPRITILTASFPRFPGGGSRVYLEHANRLARRGYAVTVIHPLNIRPGAIGVADRAREVVRRLRTPGLRTTWMPVDDAVDQLIVDRIDASTPLPAAELRIATYWRTSELLGRLPPDGAGRLQLIQAYETWAGPPHRVDATWRLPIPTAVVSTALYRKALELGVPRDRLTLVPNGIDHSVFRPLTPVEGRRPCIAFQAHEPPVKGLPAAIETVSRVRATHSVDVIAFGGGPRPKILPSDIPYLRSLTSGELARSVYSRASIFLCTSLSEGFGFPSLESMACGAALVSTSNGGVNDFATDGVSALIRDVGDTAGLAEAVGNLLTDEPKRVSLAYAGVASATRFTWERSADAFHRAVQTALPSQVGR